MLVKGLLVGDALRILVLHYKRHYKETDDPRVVTFGLDVIGGEGALRAGCGRVCSASMSLISCSQVARVAAARLVESERPRALSPTPRTNQAHGASGSLFGLANGRDADGAGDARPHGRCAK